MEHDNFRSRAFLNSPEEGLTIKNDIQFPISFAPFETNKVFVVAKEAETREEKTSQGTGSKLTMLGQQYHIDKSQSLTQNYDQVTPGESLTYGDKQLIFQGLVQQEPYSQDRGLDKATGKPKELSPREIACIFEFIDKKQNISQKFVVSPRYYQSNETAGDGDGLYEFRPRLMQSLPYSEYKRIELKRGSSSGQFLITYEQDASQAHNLTSNARLTAVIELSEMSEFLKVQVDLPDIPVTSQKKSEIKDSLV